MTMLAHVAGWTLIHFIWEGAAIAIIVWIALRLARKQSANVRYLMACAGLVAMIAAPAATARTLPNLIDADSVGAELARPDRARRPVSGPHADSNTTAAATPAERDRPKRGWTERARAEQAPPLRQSFAAKTVDATPLDRFVRGITLAWLLGVFVLLGRMLGGWWRVRRLQRIALATPPSRWQLACRRLAERLDVVAAHVVESTLVDVPTVVGWLRPVILLPVAAVAALTPAQVEAILAHELAHIRRHDYAVNVLQRLRHRPHPPASRGLAATGTCSGAMAASGSKCGCTGPSRSPTI